MYKNLKSSKFNYYINNQDGDLIVYNFLVGLSSLTKVIKQNTEEFMRVFFGDKLTDEITSSKYIETTKKLVDAGILVDSKADELALYDSVYYEDALDSKLNLFILPTGRCNFKCIYCFERTEPFYRGTLTCEAQKAIVKYFQRNIHKHTEVRVSWFGGEPLLEPAIIKYLSDHFINICNKRFIPYSAEITTNGYLLDIDTFDMLYNLKVYNYMITIDGLKEQHDSQRMTCGGEGTFDVIIKNLLEIKRRKDYKYAHIKIRINMTRRFANVVDDFITFIDKTFADDSRFTFQFSTAMNFSDAKTAKDDVYIGFDELFPKLINNQSYVNKHYSNAQKISLIEPGQRCVASKKNSFVIAPDLNVYKCYSHYELEVNKIGHININGDLSLNKALHQKWYLKNEFIQRIPSSCHECFYLPSCHYGNKVCPVRYLKPQPEIQECPLNSEKFKIKMSNALLYASITYPCSIISF